MIDPALVPGSWGSRAISPKPKRGGRRRKDAPTDEQVAEFAELSRLTNTPPVAEPRTQDAMAAAIKQRQLKLNYLRGGGATT